MSKTESFEGVQLLFIMQNLSPIEISIHNARMCHIRGDVDQSLSLYKNTIQQLIEYSSKYPQQAPYYSSYAQALLEEAELIHKIEESKKQSILSMSSRFPPLPPQQNNGQAPQVPPKPLPNNLSRSYSGLSGDDIRSAAVGIGMKAKQLNEEYKIVDTCKTVGRTCVTKAKELDEQYELRKKAVDMGKQIKEWDEKNGVSTAIINGSKRLAESAGQAIKSFADQSSSSQQSKPY